MVSIPIDDYIIEKVNAQPITDILAGSPIVLQGYRLIYPGHVVIKNPTANVLKFHYRGYYVKDYATDSSDLSTVYKTEFYSDRLKETIQINPNDEEMKVMNVLPPEAWIWAGVPYNYDTRLRHVIDILLMTEAPVPNPNDFDYPDTSTCQGVIFLVGLTCISYLLTTLLGLL